MTNSEASVPVFGGLMTKYGIPVEVVAVPWVSIPEAGE
jgi:hypothetical protein